MLLKIVMNIYFKPKLLNHSITITSVLCARWLDAGKKHITIIRKILVADEKKNNIIIYLE